MAKHLPTVAWHTRRETDRPYQAVKTFDSTALGISFMPGNGATGILVRIDRKDARLLAKRINQCLDGTVKK